MGNDIFNFSELECVVFGKGPSFCNPVKEDNQIHVCINDATSHIDEPDILVFNDTGSFDTIDKDKLKKLKLIVLPYHPHVGRSEKPNPNVTWEDVRNNNLHLKCEWFPYNLKSSPPVAGYVEFDSELTSSNTAVEFLVRMGVKSIKTYGIGFGSGYNPLFPNIGAVYNVNSVKEEIIKRCSDNNVKLEMF
jgi:hypothetical protein